MSDTEEQRDLDGVDGDQPVPEVEDRRPEPALTESMSMREHEVELDYEAEEDDHNVSKEDFEVRCSATCSDIYRHWPPCMCIGLTRIRMTRLGEILPSGRFCFLWTVFSENY
jgi:hypothetical protein